MDLAGVNAKDINAVVVVVFFKGVAISIQDCHLPQQTVSQHLSDSRPGCKQVMMSALLLANLSTYQFVSPDSI